MPRMQPIFIEAVAWGTLNTCESDEHGSVKADRLAPAQFLPRLSGEHVGLTLVYPGTCNVQSHLEDVRSLHTWVEDCRCVILFRLHVPSHYRDRPQDPLCSRCSRYSENLLPIVGSLGKFRGPDVLGFVFRDSQGRETMLVVSAYRSDLLEVAAEFVVDHRMPER